MALVSAACLAAPATTPNIHDSAIATATIPVELSAAVTSFDPLSRSARALAPAVDTTDPAALAGAIDTMASLSGEDPGLLFLKLLSAPYHNIASISIAVGKAVNAGIQFVSLPFSILTYVIANKPDDIPAYITQVQNNLKGALPGISAAITSEIAYDRDLIQQIFGGNTATTTVDSVSAPSTVTADATDSGLAVLKLLTAPYHNFASISIAVGKAVNAGIQLVSLPLSVLTYVIANKPDDIPAYITQVQTNLKNALPGISAAITSEIAYDRDLIQQVFGGGATALSTNAQETPNLLAAQTSSANILGGTPHVLTAAQDEGDTANDTTPHRETWKERIAAKKAARDEQDQKDESASTDSDTTHSDTTPVQESPSTPTSDTGTDTADAPKQSKHRLLTPAGDKAAAAESTGGKHRKPEADSGADAA
ncbi:hypothetical protein EU78_26170 [Mycolicibacterium rufum]|nr:hypothetical protein EU78_26170 [Mycolicibacterium rufum]